MSIRTGWRLLLACSLLGVGVFAIVAESKEKPADSKSAAKDTKTAKKSRVRVTISKETTYITEPLRPDGYPDYLASLNQRLSKGVTPENNAAVLFWKAMGPGEMKKDCRERCFRMLGMTPLPEKGDYFVGSSDWVEREKKNSSKLATELEESPNVVWDTMTAAMRRPWSKQDFPLWAGWLQANEKPMALIVEACRRPRCYEPLITDADNKEVLMVALLPAAQQSRECARALCMRAMFRLGEGNADEAWNDLLDCHRLARLRDEGATLIDGLIAITIDSIAQAGDQGLLRHGKLTSAQIAKMRADLDKLPPLSKMVDRIDVAERYCFLDCVSMMAREGPKSMAKLVGGEPGEKDSFVKSLADAFAASSINWDIPLRMANSWYDRLVAAGRKPTRAERVKAANQIDGDIKQMVASAKDPANLALSLLGGPRDAISERIGQMLVALIMPATMAAQTAEDRVAMQMELTKAAFALAAYRAEQGSYPAKLADLVPKYTKELPKDIFDNEGELHYSRQGDGYLLYSVGPNGKDDGGKSYDDRKNNEDWDDLTVSMSSRAP